MPVIRESLSRVVAVISRKGGVGKTSITTNVGVLAARDEDIRVLIVSIDPQNNIAEDLGFAQAGLETDDGANLAAAIRGRDQLKPLKDVRPRVDVIPGGEELELLSAELRVELERGEDVSEALALALQDIADDYDLVLLDCSPGLAGLQHLALVAARWLIIPTAADRSSTNGIVKLAENVASAAQWNPDLALLGVVIFDVPWNATRMKNDTAREIAASLGHDAPILTTSIRTAKAAARDGRKHGQVMHELAETGDKLKVERLQVLAARRRGQEAAPASPALPEGVASSARRAAADYDELTTEIINALSAAEEEAGATA